MAKKFKNLNINANIEGQLKVQNSPTNSDDNYDVLVRNKTTKLTESVDKSAFGGGSITPISKTTAELRALIVSNTLVNGAWYINTDYQTIYAQPDYDVNGDIKSTLVIKTGSVEPLLLFAISDSSFASEAYSLNFPKDKLLYDINVDTTFDYGGATNSAVAKGRIYERIDENNNRTDFDHRVVEFIRYDDGNGNYTVVNDNGNTAQEFLSFNIAQSFDNYFASVYPFSQFVNREFGNNVFYDFLLGNEFSSSTANNTFREEVISSRFSGNVDYNTFSGKVHTNTFSGDIRKNTFSNSVQRNTFSGGVNQNTFSGTVSNNIFSGTVSNNTFIGNLNINTFIGNLNTNTFGEQVSNNTFSGSLSYNTFTHTTALQYVTIDCAIASKTITETLYPSLFGTDFHKEIVNDATTGDVYLKTESPSSVTPITYTILP